MNKKAQLSFETIIIYGLIIVVVTLAVGALVYFGVLDLGRLLPEKCNAGAPMVCETYQITTTPNEEVKLEIRNKAGKRVNYGKGTILKGADDWLDTDCPLKSVQIGESDKISTLTGDLFVGPESEATVGIDRTVVLTFDCKAAFKQAESQRYKATMTLEYQTVGSSLAQRVTGQLFAAISKGADASS